MFSMLVAAFHICRSWCQGPTYHGRSLTEIVILKIKYIYILFRVIYDILLAHRVRNIEIYFIKGSTVHVVMWVVTPYCLVSEEYTAVIFRAVSCQCKCSVTRCWRQSDTLLRCLISVPLLIGGQGGGVVVALLVIESGRSQLLLASSSIKHAGSPAAPRG